VTPVTRPDVETIATIVADELHSNLVLTVLPTESRATAVSCTLSPTAIVGCGEDTKMLATRTEGPFPPSPLQAVSTAQTTSEAMRRIEISSCGFIVRYDDQTREEVSSSGGVARRYSSQESTPEASPSPNAMHVVTRDMRELPCE
jgi:hypothetical protein